MGNVLVIGASGQLGSVLTGELQKKKGKNCVIATDLRPDTEFDGTFEVLDATDYDLMDRMVKQYDIDEIYHLAAILSANGEKNPLNTWDINMKTFFNVLEVSRKNKVKKVFYPSSMAVFGSDVDQINTPQSAFLNPSTVYGISKVSGEIWGQYYFLKYGLDIRSLRYPGVIGYQSLPGGGTTDYAVDIFHKAVLEEKFTCFLQEDTTLPMIYMDDAIRATIELMEAPAQSITNRTSYNLAGMSFSPKKIVAAVRSYYPQLKVEYAPDFRQQIAESWPQSIDDSLATKDWGWQPKFTLESMTKDMIANLQQIYSKVPV